MWKFLVIFAVASLATSKLLQITPEDVKARYKEIQDELRTGQNNYLELGYYTLYSQFSAKLENVILNLTDRALTTGKEYLDSVTEILEQTEIHGKKDLFVCIRTANEEFKDSIIEVVSNATENLKTEYDQFSKNVSSIFLTIADDFNVMEGQVNKCDDANCAAELDSVLTTLYARVQEEEEQINDKAEELNKSVENLDFDVEAYEQKIKGLIQEVKTCPTN